MSEAQRMVVTRLVSRAIVLDEDDRILLLLTDFPRHAVPALRWITPGGGVEPGEDHRQGVIRELFEETGLRIADPGEPVWSLDTVEFLADGREQHSHSEFYLVRTAHFDPVDDHWMDDERVDIRRIHWWSLDELRETTDVVGPEGLATRIGQILGR